MIEADRVAPETGAPEIVPTPTQSGRGQNVARCPVCRVAIWSDYAVAGGAIKFVRVGTLDQPDLLPPDIQIHTASQQPWVVLPPNARTVEASCDGAVVWPPDSLERLRVLLAR